MQITSLLVRKRIATLFLLFTLGFFVLGGRVFWVQFVRGAELSAEAALNRTRDVPVESKRGIIYDRNGHDLAISVSADSVYAIPAEVVASKREQEIAQKLAVVLGMEEGKLLQRITRQSSYEWIKRQIEPEISSQIRSLDLPGIGLTEESRRYYPKGSLAAHVLGISGVDNTGLEGIDYYYNELVGGEKGRIVIEHDAYNRPIPEAVHEYIPPVDGANLILTIDETIQYIMERELDKVFTDRQAKAATGIIMDPNTGEILALANRPTFNPNNFNDFPAANRRNWAISNAYEPGSTMKITTAAMALNEAMVNEETPFFCTGSTKVGRETIGCPDRRAHGQQTFAQIVENSCNVSFVQLGLSLGADKYYHYLYGFGFGEPTGIDLPGEAEGILVPRERAKQIDLATMSMGQANAVTPIQLCAAVAAVANGGKLMKPYLVKQVVDQDGQVLQENEPTVIREVISEDTAHRLSLILEGEVINGTGKNAFIEGYRAGGKTGTAQKIAPGGGYLSNEYVASFIGYAPAHKPRLLCFVVVDAPQGYPYYGGWVAAPVFRDVLKDSLRYLEEPMYEDEDALEAPQEESMVAVPDVINLSLEEAVAALRARSLQSKVNGSGNVVWQQTPIANSRLKPGSQVILNMSEVDGSDHSGAVTVPDLQGKSMREVARILSELGLHLMPEGHGLAYQQIPEPGMVITGGSTIKVKFQPIGE